MPVPSVLRKMIGKPGHTFDVEIEKNEIRRFAEAIGEDNPIHFDEAAAKDAGYGSLAGTPTFASSLQHFELFFDALQLNQHNLMHAEEEYEYFRPIVAGDTMSVTHSLANAYEKPAPNGSLLFVVIETRGTDEKKRLIFKGRRVMVELRK